MIDYDYLAANPKDYNSVLDTLIKMQQNDYIAFGKLQFVKELKERALIELKYTKLTFDIFCFLEIIYEVVNYPSNNGYTEYHINKIIKNYFRLSDISYMLKNGIKYSTYDKMHRKEKLEQIFGNELK
jgi:hypothetical protein